LRDPGGLPRLRLMEEVSVARAAAGVRDSLINTYPALSGWFLKGPRRIHEQP
jgi:hypothetical protein